MSLPHTLLKRTFSTTNVVNVIKNVTVIGGGLMGSGIAQVSQNIFLLKKQKSISLKTIRLQHNLVIM